MNNSRHFRLQVTPGYFPALLCFLTNKFLNNCEMQRMLRHQITCMPDAVILTKPFCINFGFV